MAYTNYTRSNQLVALSEEQQENITRSITQDLVSIMEQDDKFVLPPGYSPARELKSAMLKLAEVKDRNGNPALAICSPASITLAMRNMVMQGLSMERKQCYPIVYGNQLQIQQSYFGTVSIIERMFPNLIVHSQAIFQGDTFDYSVTEEGWALVSNHQSAFQNRDKPLVGCYCKLINRKTKEVEYCEVMTKREIDISWSHAKTKNVQQEFPEQMAKRTVIQRACKMYLNAHGSNLSIEQVAAYNNMLKDQYDEEPEPINVTPREAEKRRAIKSRSRGQGGLDAILKEGQDAPLAPSKGETAPPASAPAPVSPPQGKAETAPKQTQQKPQRSEAVPPRPDFFDDPNIPF